jgi:hypothetical protein
VRLDPYWSIRTGSPERQLRAVPFWGRCQLPVYDSLAPVSNKPRRPIPRYPALVVIAIPRFAMIVSTMHNGLVTLAGLQAFSNRFE